MSTTQNRFEDRLLLALQAVVDANPVPVPALSPARRSMRRPVLAGGAAASLAVAATSLMVAGGSSAAYAVDAHADGSVLEAADRDRHAAVGVKAVVDYLPAGKDCKQPRFTAPTGNLQGDIRVDIMKDGPATFTIGKDDVPAGDTLVIVNSGGDGAASVGVSVAAGPVAPCVVVDATAPVQGEPGSGPSYGTASGGGPAVTSKQG